MYKRMSIRIVPTLSEDLNTIAKNRGLSVNALVSEMAWDFVEDWKSKCTDPTNSVGVGK